MKLSQIEYFLAVAEHLNFTAAAKSLYISQPALSKQIALLEEELGTRLFLRNSRRVALTAAGNQLKLDLTEIHRQLELAQKRAIEIGKTGKQIFRIGCFDGAVVDDFLPAVFQHIHQLAPDIEISLFRGNFQENRKALEQDAIDLLLTLDIEHLYGEEYQTLQLLKRRGALIYSANSPLAQKEPLSLEDFSQEPFLVLNHRLSPGLYQHGIANLKQLGLSDVPVVELENFPTLFAYLEIGHGFALLTEEAADGNPLLKKILVDESMGISILAVWKKEHPLTQVLMDHLEILKS